MGELILLAERRADRSRLSAGGRPAFFFDLSDPFSYLAAERVDRMLGGADWVAVGGQFVGAGDVHGGAQSACQWTAVTGALRCRAEAAAQSLRLPLIWPETFPAPVQGAMRAAVYAAEMEAGPRFALAASRLAFCGGFDLEDPDILAEAASAAGLSVAGVLAAASDPSRDLPIRATGRGLARHGVRQLPAIRLGQTLLAGEDPVAAAMMCLRSPASA